MKKLEDMNLFDDFLFWHLLANKSFGPDAARIILGTILQKPIGELTVHTQEAVYGVDSDKHGIRMDAYVTETDLQTGDGTVRGDIYDIEPDQNVSEKASLPYRTRYYHVMADTKCLDSGEDYKSLRKAYIIMLLPYDPFGKGRMLYTVKASCVELPELPYDDGSYTLYLYADGDSCGLSDRIANLLKYMKESLPENAVEDDLKKLNQYVESVKHDRGVQKAAMKFSEILQNERKEAEKLAVQAQELAAQEKERADQAEERADQAEERADRAEERAVQAQELADQEKERADRAEGRLKELEKKLAELES